MHVDPWSLLDECRPSRKERRTGINRWRDDWQATCNTSCRDQTREGGVKEEVDCTMLFVDGGFSIDIIFDHSLWRWEQMQRKENGRSQHGREGEKERERMEKKKHELAVIEGWDILKKQKGAQNSLIQYIYHFYYCTSETSPLLIFFMHYIQNISIYWSLTEEGSGRLFDAEQFNDIQRIISETTHGPQASKSLYVLVGFKELQIKSSNLN